MQRTFPDIPFERFADDAIVHCRSEKQARFMLDVIRTRLSECGLDLHPTKTKIVYCQDDDRRGTYESIK
jgi:retron-type reverse transcriptase